MKKLLVSIVIPCLNEEKAIGKCVSEARSLNDSSRPLASNNKVRLEILVVDNGSTDNSKIIAKKAGAKVIFESRKGYGRALLTGMERAKGEILIFADGDGSYDFRETNGLMVKLLNGYDLVIGSRFMGKIEKGAMPFWHRQAGTPILNFLFWLFFKQKISDVNSGFRAITKRSFDKLSMHSTGMEFASEMLYKAAKNNLRIAQVPITYRKRVGESKLSTFRDAWRHLKFMLLFSPTYLFVLPGLVLGIVGGVVMLWLLPGKQFLMGRFFDIHTMTVASFLVLVGFQLVFLGLFARVFSLNFLGEKDENTQSLIKIFTLEKGIILGALISLIGLMGLIWVIKEWWVTSFGRLSQERMLLFSITFMTLGLEIIFSSFFFGILGREER